VWPVVIVNDTPCLWKKLQDAWQQLLHDTGATPSRGAQGTADQNTPMLHAILMTAPTCGCMRQSMAQLLPRLPVPCTAVTISAAAILLQTR
jgi:hypothetical protein